MNWEVIGSTGEWAGAIAVVASLLYLARQIKLANLQSQALARYSFLDAYGRANATIGGSQDSASVFHRGLNGDDLNEGERMQFIVLIGQFSNTWSVMYDLHQEGQLPENQWALVSSDIHAALTTPGGRSFWEDIGKQNVNQDFAVWVDELLNTDESPYPILGDQAKDA